MFGFIRPTISVIEIESSVLAGLLKVWAPLALPMPSFGANKVPYNTYVAL